MTESAVAHTQLTDAAAGADLAGQITEKLGAGPVDAVIVFASPRNDFTALLETLTKRCNPGALVGCSSAGEFTSAVAGEGLTTAMALRAPEMQFRAAIGAGLAEDRGAVVDRLLAGFADDDQSTGYAHRAALVLVDALAGYGEDLIDRLTAATGGTYRFFGGGAGDDARFQSTYVFCGTVVSSNAAVALEILSNKPLGIGARHGWTPASAPLRVTQTDSNRVISLNVAPAVEAFTEHATATNQNFDMQDPIPFFLHNIVGIKTPAGHKLRVPLGVGADGGIVCAAEIPTGATTHIMSAGTATAIDAAASATRDAMQQVEASGGKPKVALFFDCVATRLRLGKDFGEELEIVGQQLDGAEFVGFNSYGQIVRAEGQFSGFHNCTAVVCVIPE